MAAVTNAQILAALTALGARIDALESKPARGKAASPARPSIERASVCACGATYKRGRDVAEIAASPVGLCGLKGYTAHKA